ncbi:MAG: FAD-binding oxidoreductase [Candidatus Woesearchaeota archaeon]|nr:FAD-binding oxidoreductase [Candidatus Woesearchaeota archaeon]
MNFKSKVISNELIADSIKLMKLTAPADLTFKPGQFISIVIEENGKTKLRPYSLFNPPSQKDSIDFLYKLIPEGLSTPIMWKSKPGDEFELKGPFGRFLFDEKTENKEHWFIANGTGVAPFHSMLLEFLPKSPEKNFHLIFGVRSKEHLCMHDDLCALIDKYPNFTYTPTLSRENWEGSMGRVQAHLPEDLSNKTFYICGLKEMVNDTKALLESKGVDKKDIHLERYS